MNPVACLLSATIISTLSTFKKGRQNFCDSSSSLIVKILVAYPRRRSRKPCIGGGLDSGWILSKVFDMPWLVVAMMQSMSLMMAIAMARETEHRPGPRRGGRLWLVDCYCRWPRLPDRCIQRTSDLSSPPLQWLIIARYLPSTPSYQCWQRYTGKGRYHLIFNWG